MSKRCRWATLAWILSCAAAWADTPPPEEVLGVLGMSQEQIAELAQGQPVAYPLEEGSADELAVGVAWLLPMPLAKVAARLRQDDGIGLDTEVVAHGILTEQAGKNALAGIPLPKEEAQALLDAAAGDTFNLSAHEIEGFNKLKRMHGESALEAAGRYYREILFQRFLAYRHGGVGAIAAYAREDSLDSKPSLELRQADQESALLPRYFPALSKAWLDYPQPLPPGARQDFLWLAKTVENRPTVILRHRISADWNGGAVVLTREFYAAHSYNSSQWITGCMPYRAGTVVFQLLRSYTDQVAGAGFQLKHMLGRELLKDRMLNALQRLREALAGGS